jgi:hypothetical protein
VKTSQVFAAMELIMAQVHRCRPSLPPSAAISPKITDSK